MSRSPRSLVVALLILSVLACESPAPRDAEAPAGDDWEPALRELYEELLAAVERDDDDAVAHGRLGMFRHANGLKEAALRDYARAAELSPSDPKWCYLAALVHADFSRVREGVAELDRAIERWPTTAHVHWRKGLLLLDLGELDRAEASFVRAAELAGDDPVPWIGRARVELQRGNPELAARHASEAIRVAPNHPNRPYAHQLLGTAYRQLGRIEEAKEQLALGRAGRPVFADPWSSELNQYRVALGARLATASALAQRGAHDEAIRILEELREANPTHSTVLQHLGAAYLRRGARDRAREVLEVAMQHHPDDALVRVSMSRVLAQLEEYEESLAMADRAVEIHPFLPVVHAERARALARLDRFDEALAAYSEALRLAPNAPEILLEAARLAQERQRWTDAESWATTALEIRPRSVPALVIRGRARTERGDLDGADRDLRRAVELRPVDPEVAAARRELTRRRGR